MLRPDGVQSSNLILKQIPEYNIAFKFEGIEPKGVEQAAVNKLKIFLSNNIAAYLLINARITFVVASENHLGKGTGVALVTREGSSLFRNIEIFIPRKHFENYLRNPTENPHLILTREVLATLWHELEHGILHEISNIAFTDAYQGSTEEILRMQETLEAEEGPLTEPVNYANLIEANRTRIVGYLIQHNDRNSALKRLKYLYHAGIQEVWIALLTELKFINELPNDRPYKSGSGFVDALVRKKIYRYTTFLPEMSLFTRILELGIDSREAILDHLRYITRELLPDNRIDNTLARYFD